ncbi:MAG TPA: chromosome segregation protein SMC, partial [Afifellaceae bacterium]|nr:chromosome segregation protein SMC [Afifellaceae bacterium]
VGPNGCGKSNLVEALRFVMGESSYKAMRGSGMDDVIFSGSANRPSRNTAEVTLFADAMGSVSAAALTGAASEGGAESAVVEVTRRIEREAGSVYRLNGKDVRARDVQLLFADAASGARSSALVRQGQIGEIISAKPTQRRGILEDAAGISGLHSRRHEAELKLRAADQNLERLEDITNEITAQLDTLKRQARQAVRYRNLSGEIRKAEGTLFLIRWQAACERYSEAETALTEATALMAEATQAQALTARNEAVSESGLPELREKSAQAAVALQRIQISVQELEREEERLAARRRELEKRRGEAAQDLSRESEIQGESRSAIARLSEENESLAAEAASAREHAEQIRADAQSKSSELAEREMAFSEASVTLASKVAERASLHKAIENHDARLARLKADRERVEQERQTLEARLAADSGVGAATQAADEAEAALAELETALAAAEERLQASRAAEQAAREPREAAVRALSALEAEARTLARMLEGAEPDLFPPLIDAVSVSPGYELALAAGLGDDLEASLDRNAPRYWTTADGADAAQALPGGAQPLSAHVEAPGELALRLAQTGVVDAADGDALQGALRPGQRLVSREGDLWRWDGYRMIAGAPTAAAQRLEQRNRLSQLDEEIDTARNAVALANEACNNRLGARQAAEQAEQEHRRDVRAGRAELDRRRTALSEAERSVGRSAERLSAVQEALTRIESDQAQSDADRAAACEALAALDDISDSELKLEELRAVVETERLKAAEARAVAESVEREERVRAARLAQIASELEGWSERLARADQRMAALSERRDELGAELEKLDEQPDIFEERRKGLLSQVAEIEEQRGAADDALAAAEAAHRQAAEAARAALETLSSVRETRAREEERVEAARTRRDEIIAQIKDIFDSQPQDLRAIAELKPEAALPEMGAMEKRVDRLKNERERLGGVNLRAEEEAREIEGRLETIHTERADLEAAIRQLRNGINTLNREARQRLLEAFDEVNGHFQSLFTHLFGGGTAELTLTESDDPLEAGLEIIAKPPGKKPQTMTLLSGGEQALTAMSLIFAVFLTNPSPICVLDEVDAPLDDANVERFCALLDDMRKRTDTRFVVVTHNPITMAQMDRLFGVTMAERGVSQLVSVDLQTAERFREAV